MDKLAADDKYAGKVNFLMVNLQGVEDAKKYQEMKSLTGACPHGASNAGNQYGVKYIPHKTLVGKDGVIIKNYEGFKWEDIDGAM